MAGELRMVGDDVGTTANLVADLVANVPFLGGRIEKACEPLVQRALETEETVGPKWLAEHR